MPYEPTFPHPYLEAIDVNQEGGNNFQCVINPRDTITAYEITISSVEDGAELCQVSAWISDGKQVKYYSIGEGSNTPIPDDIPSSDSKLPLKGKANSDDSILVVNIPQILTTENVLVNGKEYFWNIKLTSDNNSVTSKDFYFTSVATPKILLEIPPVVNSNRINLSAVYSQGENLSPAYYRFALYNKAREIYTTDDIFSSDIVFEYDKLISDEDYELELTVVLDSGMEITENYCFSVSYTEANGLLFSTVEVDNKNTYISIDYSQQISIGGVFEGDGTTVFAKARNDEEEFPDVPNILTLNDNQSVYWNRSGSNLLDFENSNQVIHWHAHDDFEGIILEKIDESDSRRNIRVSFSEGAFCYANGQNEPEYHCLYKSEAEAIAGSDEYSTTGIVRGYSEETPSITLENSILIVDGARVQVGEEYRTIINTEVGDTYTVATLDNGFNISPISNSDKYAVYSKDYRYILTDDDVFDNTDILLWNKFEPKGWYFIHLTPNGIKYIEDPNNVEVWRGIDSVPFIDGKLKYSGAEQTPVWMDYDSTKLQIGGTISATDIGNYYTTFTPINGWFWSDGTVTPKTVFWDIEVPGKTLDEWSWDQISAIASSGMARNYFSIGDCKFIDIKGTVGTKEVDETCYVYIIGFDHNGATNTIDFGTFKNISPNQYGNFTDFCLVDDKYNSYVTNDEKYFNMNHNTASNYGGWKGCDLRYDILGSTNVAPDNRDNSSRRGYDATDSCATNPVLGTLMSALPENLRKVMKPMTIYTDNVGGNNNLSTNVTSSIDYLPLLAEFEVWGEQPSYNANPTEKDYQKQYEYYYNGNSKLKYKDKSTYQFVSWWLRSPHNDDNYYCSVYYYSNDAYRQVFYSYYSCGISPIFRV